MRSAARATAMRSTMKRDGNRFLHTDATALTNCKLPDIEKVVAGGVDALIIRPVDKEAIGPGIDRAASGIPTLGHCLRKGPLPTVAASQQAQCSPLESGGSTGVAAFIF